MKLRFSIFALIALTTIVSCDVIDDPIIPISVNYREDLYGPPPQFNAPENTDVRILIEKFTGHQCGFCPPAAVLADSLNNEFPDDIIVAAIHAGGLAAFNEEPPYDIDWTTEAGDTYWEQLDGPSNPAGRINRSGGSNIWWNPNFWEDQINDLMGQEAIVSLQMESSYQSEYNHLNVHVNGHFNQPFSVGTHLVVLLLESGLYDYQLWYGNDPEVIPDYHFKHTLRTALTGPEGLIFTSEPVVDGFETQRNYTLDWNPEWEVSNCEVVAFVVEDETGEILDAVKVEL